MTAQVLAVVNMKGGVGKTVTVVSLADTLAARGLGPVLVIDVDTQASASYCLAGDDKLTELIKSGRTIDQFLEARLIRQAQIPLEHFVQRQVSNTTAAGKGQLDVALVPSSTKLRLSEREVLHKLTQKGLSLTGIEMELTNTLEKELHQLGQEFRYVIFDCAPGISPFTTAAVSLANLVIVPTIPDFLSFLGLDAFLHSVRSDMTNAAGRRAPHVLITRSLARSPRGWATLWNASKGKKQKMNHHDNIEKQIRSLAKKSPQELKVFRTTIDEAPAIPVAMSMGAAHKSSPTFQMKYPAPLNKVLDQLTKEIEEALR